MRFSVLGPLEVASAGTAVNVAGTRRRAVLGVLLLRANQPVPVSTILDCLWPQDPPASAVANVRTYVHDLRRQCGHADGSADRLRSVPGGYRLSVGQGELDLLSFRDLAAAGRQLLREGDPAAAAERLGAALGLWYGQALGDLELGPPAAAKLAALEEERKAAVSAWVEAHLALGQHEEIIPSLRQLVTEDPLQERAWGQLLVALGDSGRTAEALEAYQHARRILLDELAVEPGAELQQIQTALLAGEPRTAHRALDGRARGHRRTGAGGHAPRRPRRPLQYER